MSGSQSILGARILVADDQEADARLIATMLAGAGYTAVITTCDPLAVAELHRKHRYDLVILDVLMPGMDGFEVMAALKAIDPEDYLPIIVVTAEPDHMKRALEAGARDFIGKPIRMAELAARVHNLLELGMLLRSEKAPRRPPASLLDGRTAELDGA